MRINLRLLVAAAVLAVCFSVLSVASAQQNIVYPGAVLRDPSVVIGPLAPTMPNSLFPNTPSNNTVTVNSGTVAGHVFGGITATVRAESSNNRVFISGGTIGSSTTGGNVTGGWSLAGDVLNNAVTIDGGNVWNIIYGGWIRGDGDAATFGFNAKNNSVTIDSGSIIHNNIYGAYSQESRGELSGNTVTILDGTIRQTGAADNNIITGAYSALAANNVSGNSVTIQGGTINNYNIFGARGQNASQVLNNTVTISDGIIHNDVSATSRAIYGGHISIGASGGVVSGNTVNITGGTISVAVYGGYATANSPSSNYNHATGNFVNISGGTVTGDIYGGFSSYGNATGNTVTIDGGTITGNLYGGNRAAGTGHGDVFTGNTLNLKNFNAASTFGTIQNFDFINFGNTLTVHAASLDITPTGSTRSGTTVYVGYDPATYNLHEIAFEGAIEFDGNTGTLTKTGFGTLAFTDMQDIEGKTLTLNTTGGRIELFGITDNGTGTGTLNIINTGPAGTGGGVFLVNDGKSNTFEMGTVNVSGTGANRVVLNLYRTTPTGTTANFRVGLKTDSFNIKGDKDWNTGSVLLAGGGLIDATGGSINIDGALLSPDEWLPPAGAVRLHSTLSLKAETITLANFAMLFSANYYENNRAQDPLNLTAANPIDISNNTLLQLDTGGTNKVNISNGTIVVTTIDGNNLEQGDYLVIRTNNGMNGINTDADLSKFFALQIDDFVVKPDPGNLVRGTFGFKLGGDPVAGTGAWQAGTTNLWLASGLNSLTMEWTGLANNRWEGGNHFDSLQGLGAEHNFLPGDFVYVTGAAPTTTIELPPGLSNIMVSGLVVGKNMVSGTENGGNVTFIGTGGITANEDSAFGDYVNKTSTPLVPTGKLEKHGSGTLTFKNTGGNDFKDGMDIHGGTIAFDLANQLGNRLDPLTSELIGNDINFIGNGTKLQYQGTRDATIANDIFIDNGMLAKIEVIQKNVKLAYTGQMTGNDDTTLEKSGAGTLRLEKDSLGLEAAVIVSAGTLDIAANYGNTSQFNVKDGATLTGSGTIGATVTGGTIEAGGTLMPGDRSIPNMGHLTVNGNLTFEENSIFHVRIAPSHVAQPVPDSDYVHVLHGNVDIAEGAKLNIDAVYGGGGALTIVNQSDKFKIIEMGTGTHSGDYFDIEKVTGLPHGIKIVEDWDTGDGNLNLLFRYEFDPEGGLGALCTRHNRSEIGKTLDGIMMSGEVLDPGMHDLIERLTDPNNPEVCKQLDQIHGDLAANAMFMALKEPWRHPFNRLTLGCPIHKRTKFQQQLWGEFTARYENVGFDNNAHPFTINRYGLAVGVDQRISQRSVVGATFQYAEPRLRQETGKVKMDDYELGLYGMTRLTESIDAKAYLGYSHQRYDLNRYVWLPATAHYEALFDQLYGKTSGDALAASIELSRTMPWRRGMPITPVIAFDFEHAWMRGYRESAVGTTGDTALVYDSATLARAMIRFGVGSEYSVHDKLRLNARLQYAAQLNDREHPALGARFVKGLEDQRTADIWGSRMGRDYFNFGLGMNRKLGNRDDKMLYVNYDAKWYDRATFHLGEAGFVKKW